MKWGIRCHLTDHFLSNPVVAYDYKDGNAQCWFGGNNSPHLYTNINTAFRECETLNSNLRDTTFINFQCNLYYIKEYV